MYIALSRGWNPLGTKFWCEQEHLVTLIICCKFQKHLLKVWYYTFFFIHVYSPGAGADSPQGTKFDVNRNILSLCSFVACFKKMSLKSEFIQCYHDLIHVYSPGARTDSPQGQNFYVNRKALLICCKFQRNLFEVRFYTTVFMIQYMYLAPGQGADCPKRTKFWCQQKLRVTSVICCLFQIIDDNSFWKIHCFNFFPYKSIRDQIRPCCKIGQGPLTVIIWAKNCSIWAPDDAYQFSRSSDFGSGEDVFRFSPYMSMAAILVMWPGPFEQTFVPPSHRSSIWNLTLIGPVVSEGGYHRTEYDRFQTTFEPEPGFNGINAPRWCHSRVVIGLMPCDRVLMQWDKLK